MAYGTSEGVTGSDGAGGRLMNVGGCAIATLTVLVRVLLSRCSFCFSWQVWFVLLLLLVLCR